MTLLFYEPLGDIALGWSDMALNTLHYSRRFLIHQLVNTFEDGYIPDNKVHGANMGTTWVLSAPDGPHVGPTNLAIRDIYPIYKREEGGKAHQAKWYG